MKKSILILAAVLSSVVLQAQTVTLKYAYSPNTIYKSSVNIGINMDMTGPDKAVMKMNTTMGMTYSITTESPKAEGNFPFIMKYTDMKVKATVNGAEQAMPANNPLIGQVIYGQCDKAGKIHIDSVAGGVDEQKKAMIMEMINQVQDQMKFPDKPMKVGETATIDIPLKVPGAGMDMASKATYKLVAVKAGLAYFDVVQSMKMDMKQEDKTFGISGNGAGKMTYNIAQKFPVAYITNVEMTMNMPQAGMENMKMKMTMDMKTEVSAK